MSNGQRKECKERKAQGAKEQRGKERKGLRKP